MSNRHQIRVLVKHTFQSYSSFLTELFIGFWLRGIWHLIGFYGDSASGQFFFLQSKQKIRKAQTTRFKWENDVQ